MIEISVVIPCLNEEKTIASCINKAQSALSKASLSGEIIIVDNGSTDNTVAIVAGLCARIVCESRKGYGNALRTGIEESLGKYIVMADGDDTYDFSEINKFVSLLQEGYELVMGSRFKGKILPGAMTWSHRYIGNPILSSMLRIFFGGGVSDSHCGLRAFTKEAYIKMDLHTTGMEFASEMVIHSLKKKLKITEIPITYYPRQGESKLSSFRDAWRHIRFMLIYSPGYLFLFPGLIIFLLNFFVTVSFIFGPLYLFGRFWGIHVMVLSSILTLLGWQILNMGIAAKVFAFTISLEEDKWIRFIVRVLTLERVLFFGVLFVTAGIGIICYIFYVWSLNNFGELKQVNTGMLALVSMVMGLQTIFTSFLVSMLQIKYR